MVVDLSNTNARKGGKAVYGDCVKQPPTSFAARIEGTRFYGCARHTTFPSTVDM
jgi:hypothetical protein